MATDFWASSHYRRWIVDRASLRRARLDDLQYVEDPDHLDFLGIYFANLITKLGRKLQFRQRVIATATVFFRRFYLKNSYSETDPFTVIAACCYLAAKAEESPIHIKTVVQEARAIFNHDLTGFPWTTDNQKIAEMEFYLVDDLECDLVVFHPYRTLLALCKKEATLEQSEEGETQDVGAGLGTSDGPRYWGTGEGQLELPPGALQVAWSIINDTYRSQLCLLHPPHLIAIAAIYLSFIIHPPPRTEPQATDDLENSQPQPRRSSRQASTNHKKSQTQAQDPITFLAELNVSLPLVASISQEIISLYTLWDQYKEDVSPDAARLARELTGSPPATGGSMSSTRQNTSQGYVSHYSSQGYSWAGTPGTDMNETLDSFQEVKSVTPAFLTALIMKMREMKVADTATTPPPSSTSARTTNTVGGKRTVVNKRLERAQTAG